MPYVFSHRVGLRAGARHLEPQPELSPVQLDIEVSQIRDLTGVGEKPENAAELRQLADKIAKMGLLQPIVVEPREDGQYNAVAGQLRLAACKMLGWKSIPAIVREGQ